MAKVAANKTEMEEEVEAKLSDSAQDGSQRVAKEKELAGLRRQRGLERRPSLGSAGLWRWRSRDKQLATPSRK